MKNQIATKLKSELIEAVNTVLINNKYYLSQRIEKTVRKSMKKIVQKTGKQTTQTIPQI